MMIKPPYKEFFDLDQFPSDCYLVDHIWGFDKDGRNILLDHLQQYAIKNDKTFSVEYVQAIEPSLANKYYRLGLKFNFQAQHPIWNTLSNYNIHPVVTYKNFVCSFNGSPHVSRKLLVSALHRFNWFNPEYVSKNFSYSTDSLDGHVLDYTTDQHRIYRKFFIGKDSENFFQTINSFGHVRFDHGNNIYNLEHKLTESFLHLISETVGTSYYPFVTEKFLYSVITRGLFLAYAQPGWHDHLEKYYGFRQYHKIFDYQFDQIKNPGF